MKARHVLLIPYVMLADYRHIRDVVDERLRRYVEQHKAERKQ